MLRFFLRIDAKYVITCAPPERQLSRGRHFQTKMKNATKTQKAVTALVAVEAILSIIYLIRELLM